MITFDLKIGYHQIDIHPESQACLGFAWKGSKDRSFSCYVFTVLSFGLSSAPFIFTKCLKPLQKQWRKQGTSIYSTMSRRSMPNGIESRKNVYPYHKQLDKTLGEPA